MSGKSDVARFEPCAGPQDDVTRLLDLIEALTVDLERNGSRGTRWEKEVAREQLRSRLVAAAHRAAREAPRAAA